MAPTIIARWTREGRRFRSVGVAPRDEGDAGDSAKLDDDGPA